MAPLTLRPANPNAPAAGASAPNRSSSSTSKIVAMEEGEDMEDAITRHDRRELDENRARRLTAKNRRKRYLEVHPEYFHDSSLELADPLLYDRLVRRFQTAAERQAEGQRKGASGSIETDLWRAEAKKNALSHPNPDSLFTYDRGPQGQIVEEDKDDVLMNKEEGQAWWKDEMTQRFLLGRDTDFDYKKVDLNSKYDDPEEERDLQEEYFDSMDSDFDSDGEGKEKILTGETGIQDY